MFYEQVNAFNMFARPRIHRNEFLWITINVNIPVVHKKTPQGSFKYESDMFKYQVWLSYFAHLIFNELAAPNIWGPDYGCDNWSINQ